MSAFPEKIGEIEFVDKLLEKDASGEFKKHYLDKIADCKLEFKKKIDQGLPPDAFQIVNAMAEGFEVGETVFNTVWNTTHQG